MKNNNMKEYILERGMILVAEKGFKNTGISEILKSASIPKGSFYYYFNSKTDFGLQLIDFAARTFLESIKLNFSKEIPPLERIENFFKDQINYFQKDPGNCNCLFGKLSQEITDQDPLFRSELLRIFKVWQGFFKETLKEAEENGQIILKQSPEMIASFILSGWEGAVMQSKLQKSVQPLEEFRIVFFTFILKK